MICRIGGCSNHTSQGGLSVCENHFPKCQYCRDRAAFETAKECTDCWEVRGRLNRFLRSEKNRRFTLKELSKHADFENLIDEVIF